MRSMFAYVCLGSNNLERSATFYDATLGTLGYRRCDTIGGKRIQLERVDRLGPLRKGGRRAGRAVGVQAVQRRAGQRRQWQHGGAVGAQLGGGRGDFMPRRSPTAEPRKARRVCACCTTRTSTRPTCAIPTATSSRWCAAASRPPRRNSRSRPAWRAANATRRALHASHWLRISIRHHLRSRCRRRGKSS